MTTAATFYATYKNLSLTGVTSYDEPQLDTPSAKMPCKWVQDVSVDEAQLRARAVGGERVLRCRVVVLVVAKQQNRHAGRWSDTITMIDTLNAGIKTVASKRTSWTVTAMPNYADAYFAVVADIETSEGVI